MKVKSLIAAVALATGASQVFALAPGASIDLEMNLSGATAMDIQFTKYITDVCTPGTLDSFFVDDDSSRAFSCTVDSSQVPGLSGNLNVLFRKASGGSSQGVGPVATGATNIPGINLALCGGVVNNEWDCGTTSTITVQAMVGVSDVEPSMFSISENGGQPITGPFASGGPFPINTQTFGIVVTPRLYRSLQAAQGLTTTSDDVSQMPSLSRTTVAALFSGQVDTWSQMVDASGTGLDGQGFGLTGYVEVCRRTQGSGTQAQFNAFYMGLPCSYRGASDLSYVGLTPTTDSAGGPNNITRPQIGPVVLPGPYTHEASGSSDLGKCLTDLNTAGRDGLGIQSLEKVDEGRTDRNAFKYIKIDGNAPTLDNVHAGVYRNVASASIQWNTVVSGNADRLALAQGLRDTAQNVGDVRSFNLSLQDDDPGTANDDRPGPGLFRTTEILDATQANGLADVGSMAIGGAAGAVADDVFDETNPVTPWNQRLSDPVTCSVPVLGGAAIQVGQ